MFEDCSAAASDPSPAVPFCEGLSALSASGGKRSTSLTYSSRSALRTLSSSIRLLLSGNASSLAILKASHFIHYARIRKSDRPSARRSSRSPVGELLVLLPSICVLGLREPSNIVRVRSSPHDQGSPCVQWETLRNFPWNQRGVAFGQDTA